MVKVWLRARVAVVAAGACCLAAGVMVASGPVIPAVPAAAQASSGTGAVYVPLGPVRVLDTRDGTGGYDAPVGPGGTISLQVEGMAGVPSSGVTAVVLNVTATNPTASSYVTVWPDGTTRPTASNLNFTAGETIPNLVTVPVGADGAVDFYNDAGSVNLVADLEGYYTTAGTGSLLNSAGPLRVLDTRNGTGGYDAPVGPGGTISLQAEGVDGVPAAGVTAVVLNVTATDTTASSYVTVYPDGETRPTASNLNFTAGETIPNLVVVPVGADGKVDFFNDAGSTDLVADLSGYYTAAGAGYTPAGPVRVLDTRDGTGGYDTPVGPGGTISLQVEGANGVPASGVTAVVLNVTATNPTAASYVTVYPDGGGLPTASNLNVTAGETIPNLVVVPVGADGAVDFYNDAGSVNLVADLAGYYTAGGTPWADATEVPGTAALNVGGAAQVNSVSCPSAGNCTLGGQYHASFGYQAFVADEVDGTWGDAIEVPGIAALADGGADADVTSVSCSSAGNCTAGGYYVSPAGQEAFVADEVNSMWGDAIEVPGTAALNTGNTAEVTSVSCPSAGDCAGIGNYLGATTGAQPHGFIADEVNGTWESAFPVPGIAAISDGGSDASVASVSCPSAGNCTAGGSYYNTSSGIDQAFVADEVGGSWGDAIEVPGTAALNTAGALVSSVSCASTGNCAAGGTYYGSTSSGSTTGQVFVADEVNGSWGDAIEVPGTAALNVNDDAVLTSVSCGSAGNCAAGGLYYVSVSGGSTTTEAFVVSEVNGTWDDAVQVPGTILGGEVASVSCPQAGDCVAGGYYVPGVAGTQAFVVSQVNGTWGEEIQVPGTAALSDGGEADVYSVSCPPTGSCAAAGYYQDINILEAFVASQS